MKGFVVDENVVLNAVRGSNDSGEEALVEGEFLPRLLRVKITVFVNEAIAKKFRAMGSKIRAGSRPEDCNNRVYKGVAAIDMIHRPLSNLAKKIFALVKFF